MIGADEPVASDALFSELRLSGSSSIKRLNAIRPIMKAITVAQNQTLPDTVPRL